MTTPSLTNPNPKREDEALDLLSELNALDARMIHTVDGRDRSIVGWSINEVSGFKGLAFMADVSAALASARPSPGDPARAALAPFVAHYQPWMDDWDDDSPCGAYARVTFGDLRRARAVISAPEGKATAIRSFPSDPSQKPLGYYFHNPDSGWEISDSHPITSGECEDATEIEQLTPARLKELLLQAWDDAEELRAERDDAALSVSTPTAAITVGVQTMKTSKGADYYVSVACGGRSCTPHMFLDRYKAEYEVAHWQWIFGQREEEPCILDYSEETYPNLYPKMEIPPVSIPTGEGEERHRQRIAEAICDGYSNGNQPFSEAPLTVQHSCRMAAEAVMALSHPVAEKPAALARPQQGGERDGWKLVPVEPTEEMGKAYTEAFWRKMEDMRSPSPTEHPEDGGGPFGYAYRAMLAAAPTSPSKSSGEEACQDDEDRRVCYMCDAAISEGEEFHTHPLEGDIHARCCSGEEEGA